MQNQLQVLIPSSFVVTNHETYVEKQVAVGKLDKNEQHGSNGASSTQACRSYIFRFPNRLIRLIDGPGIGDTRGTDHDTRNFKNVLNYISQYEHLNGICIFLRSDSKRSHIFFRFCVKELLRHLSINAKDNIMFVFTHTRATFYKPGDVIPILRTLLGQIKGSTGVDIPLDQDNSFMFDNEAFRFLAAHQNDFIFPTDETEAFRNSWKKSVEECWRLVKRILQCNLHAVQDTLSLNEAQQLIHYLARPIGETTRLIQENLSLAEQYKKNIIGKRSTEINSGIPQKIGKFVALQKRLTVCVSPSCTKLINVNGDLRVDYHNHCHSGCSLENVVQECIGHPILKRCSAMNRQGK